MPVRYMLSCHTSAEITEWMAYFELEGNNNQGTGHVPAVQKPDETFAGASKTKRWLERMAKKKD